MRGFFDTDGSVIYVKNYPRLEIKSKSKKLLTQAFKVLKLLGFYGSISKSNIYYRLELPGHKNLKRWFETIGFKNKKHLNRIKTIS